MNVIRKISPQEGDYRVSMRQGQCGRPLEVSVQLIDPFLRELPWYGHVGEC